MLEEHARETSKYKAEIEVLREILQLKLEAISIRLMRNILLDAPFKVVCVGICFQVHGVGCGVLSVIMPSSKSS